MLSLHLKGRIWIALKRMLLYDYLHNILIKELQIRALGEQSFHIHGYTQTSFISAVKYFSR